MFIFCVFRVGTYLDFKHGLAFRRVNKIWVLCKVRLNKSNIFCFQIFVGKMLKITLCVIPILIQFNNFFQQLRRSGTFKTEKVSEQRHLKVTT